MIKVTIFGGHEGRLQLDKSFYLTLFAGCDLVYPTIARQILARKTAQGESPASPARRTFFLTLFGGVDLKLPTLSEEFIDLREFLRSGALSQHEWDRALAGLAHSEPSVGSFTMFGGFSECELPSEDEEVESLAVQRHLGNVPAPAGEILMYGIGQRGAERRATVRRAVHACS